MKPFASMPFGVPIAISRSLLKLRLGISRLPDLPERKAFYALFLNEAGVRILFLIAYVWHYNKHPTAVHQVEAVTLPTHPFQYLYEVCEGIIACPQLHGQAN
ncbi:hypothetical protein [Cohnella abietis]|nr:hypothetical protein [Cohnella abietis]